MYVLCGHFGVLATFSVAAGVEQKNTTKKKSTAARMHAAAAATRGTRRQRHPRRRLLWCWQVVGRDERVGLEEEVRWRVDGIMVGRLCKNACFQTGTQP